MHLSRTIIMLQQTGSDDEVRRLVNGHLKMTNTGGMDSGLCYPALSCFLVKLLKRNSRKGPSGFSSSSAPGEVTQGIDGTGLTDVITGASSGIGVETTQVLALCGVHVIMAVRNMKAGRNVKEAVLKEIPAAKD